MMKKVMHWMFLSCLKATELIEKKLSFRLSGKEKLQLILHKAMCDACTRYEKQSRFIDQAISKLQPEPFSDQEILILIQQIKADLEKSKN